MASCFKGAGDRIRILEFVSRFPPLSDEGLFGVLADFTLLLTTLPLTFGDIKSFSNLVTNELSFGFTPILEVSYGETLVSPH